MKKILLMAALCAATTGCSNDKTEPVPSTDPPFAIHVSQVGSDCATFVVTPLDDAAPYYFTVVEDTGTVDAQTLVDEAVRLKMKETGWEIERVVKEIRAVGELRTSRDRLAANTPYLALAVGIDPAGKVTTRAITERFTTAEASDAPFRIELSEPTDRSIKATVTPLDEQTSYLCTVVERKTLDAQFAGDPLAYTADLLRRKAEESGKTVGEIVATLTVKGRTEKTFDGLTPETEYLLFALGIESDGTPATECVTAPFATDGTYVPFVITHDELTGTSVKITVTPHAQTEPYFYDMLPKAIWEEYHAGDAATYLEHFVQDKLDKGGNLDDIFSVIATTGTDSHDFTGMIPATEYVTFAIGIDTQCKPTTESVVVTFTTEEVVSDNLFSIRFENPQFDGIDFTVTPSNEDTYFYMWKTQAWCDKRSDDEIVAALLDEYGFMIDYLYSYTGETTYENEHVMSTDTGYCVLIFGYENGASTTPLSKFSFRTNPSATDPAQCTFAVETTGVTSSSAEVRITPSDPQVMYMWDLIDGETYRAHSASMRQYVIDYVAEDLENLDDIRIRDTDGMSFNRTLTPDTEYYVWTAAIDEFGQPAGEIRLSEPFRTLPRELSSAAVTADFVKYFDGDALYALDQSAYGNCRGLAYVYVNFHQSDDASLWYGQMFQDDLSDPTDPTDEEVIATLESGGWIWCPVGKPFLCEWDKPQTLMAVALGKDDNYGKVFRSVHTFTRSGAAPAEEIVDVLPKQLSTAPSAAADRPAPDTAPHIVRFKPAAR